MANVDASNVTTGKPKIGGAVWSAPDGTTLPTSAAVELDKAFKSLGYCSDDGVKNKASSSSDSITAWGGDTVLDVDKDFSDEFRLTLIESLNVDVLKEVFGQKQVTGDIETGVIVDVKANTRGYRVLVIDMILAEGTVLKRIVVPACKLTEVGEVTYKDDDAVGYDCTFKARPDGTGSYHKEYIMKKGA